MHALKQRSSKCVSRSEKLVITIEREVRLLPTTAMQSQTNDCMQKYDMPIVRTKAAEG
jgi:hypothetical protein